VFPFGFLFVFLVFSLVVPLCNLLVREATDQRDGEADRPTDGQPDVHADRAMCQLCGILAASLAITT